MVNGMLGKGQKVRSEPNLKKFCALPLSLSQNPATAQ